MHAVGAQVASQQFASATLQALLAECPPPSWSMAKIPSERPLDVSDCNVPDHLPAYGLYAVYVDPADHQPALTWNNAPFPTLDLMSFATDWSCPLRTLENYATLTSLNQWRARWLPSDTPSTYSLLFYGKTVPTDQGPAGSSCPMISILSNGKTVPVDPRHLNLWKDGPS